MTSKAWRAGQAALLLFIPLLPAAPGLLGFNQRTPLGLVAGFIAAHPILQGLVVIPVDAARDLGLVLLAVHVVLLGAAGIAVARMLRTIDLARGSFAGGLLYEFTAVANGPLDVAALGALIVCPAFFDMLERSLRGQRRPVLRLGFAIAFTASLGPATAPPVFLLGALWVLARYLGPASARPRHAVPRLLGGIILGTVLASPLLLPRLAMHEFEPAFLSQATAWIARPGPGPAPLVFASPILPAAGLATLASLGDRGRPLRLLLLAGFLVPIVCLAPNAARPLALTCLAALFAIRLQDRAVGSIAVLAVVLMAGIAVTLCGPRTDVAYANLAALAVALLASRNAVIPLISASWTAILAAG